jgi:mono/diheme cytochrome c family protein
MIAAGRTLYVRTGCGGCHANSGRGTLGPSIIDDKWMFGSHDELLFNLIKGQVPDQTMPKDFSTVPDDDIWKILAFVRSLYKGDPEKVNW